MRASRDKDGQYEYEGYNHPEGTVHRDGYLPVRVKCSGIPGTCREYRSGQENRLMI